MGSEFCNSKAGNADLRLVQEPSTKPKSASRREAYLNVMDGEAEQPSAAPRKPLLGPILRGMLVASVALAAVFIFIEFQPPAPAPNPAWTPKEAEGIKIAGPQQDEKPVVTPVPPFQPGTARAAAPVQRRPKITVVTRQAVTKEFAQNPAASSESATPSEESAPAGALPTTGEAPKDILDADPPPPQATASGRKPEEEKPLPKRLLRAVGRIFKGKKADPKVEPSAHNPQQP